MKIFFGLFLFTLDTILVSTVFPFGTKLGDTEFRVTTEYNIGPISLDFALYWPDGFSTSDNIYINDSLAFTKKRDHNNLIQYQVFDLRSRYENTTGTGYYRTKNKYKNEDQLKELSKLINDKLNYSENDLLSFSNTFIVTWFNFSVDITQTNNSTFQIIYIQQEKTFLSFVIHNYEFFHLEKIIMNYFNFSTAITGQARYAFSFNHFTPN